MNMERIETILRQLGYTREWLEVGVVDEECLRQQYEEYLHSDDKNQEHYRDRCVWAIPSEQGVLV